MLEENPELGHNQVPFICGSRWAICPHGDTGEPVDLCDRHFSSLLGVRWPRLAGSVLRIQRLLLVRPVSTALCCLCSSSSSKTKL